MAFMKIGKVFSGIMLLAMMNAGFVVKKAKREKIYTKTALMAPSGGGKTYSALRLATGMAEEIKKETGKDAKILMVNTEQSRGQYYADEFDYDIIDMDPPHHPTRYVEVINFAVEQGYDILIIDSSSHEWEGEGGCLELQQQAGGTYQAWRKITPLHNAFIAAIADSPIHIIATMRGKDQYEMTQDEKGKKSVQKLGIGAKQRDGFEYEFTVTFLLDQKTNIAEQQKDNTHIFSGKAGVILTEDHGRKMIQWANSGEGYTPRVRQSSETEESLDDIKKQIIALCKEKGAPENKEVIGVIKSFIANGNPNSFRSIDKAKQCLEAIKQLN